MEDVLVSLDDRGGQGPNRNRPSKILIPILHYGQAKADL